MNLSEIITFIAGIAAATGVVFAAIGLWLTKIQFVTSFEDSMSNQYREIATKIPIKALLGEEISGKEYKNNLDDIYTTQAI